MIRDIKAEHLIAGKDYNSNSILLNKLRSMTCRCKFHRTKIINVHVNTTNVSIVNAI